ncbi:MAG: UTRA domain-containing protein, partial [Clostridiales bacterium]|nr:UTRA domain-containing protein [Clostridiales bacterium]
EKKYGIYFESGKETITAQISSLFDAKLLGIDPGMPLLALHRIAYTKNHEIIEYAEKLIRPDIVQITVFMGGSPHYDD